MKHMENRVCFPHCPARVRALIALDLVACLCFCGASAQAAKSGKAEPRNAPAHPTIFVDTTTTYGLIHDTAFGANHRYDQLARGTWDKQNNRVYPGFIKAVRETGIGIVRFPAGTIGNLYHWKRAIGPIDQRPPNAMGKDSGWFGTQSNEFGPDEFGRFLEEVGARGTIVVNFATGNAAEAADWVEYMNAPAGTNPNGGTAWAEVRARNGHPKPYGITFWEVGNEYQTKDQKYWISPAGSDKKKEAQLYCFGGVTEFDKPDTVIRFADRSPKAAVSDGSPNQTFFARYPPVVEGSQKIFINGEEWKAVKDLSAVGAAKAVRFTPATGEIVFGDGTNGVIPPTSAVVTMTYRSGPHDGYEQFYKAMKAVDPSIRVYSCLQSATFGQAMGVSHPYDGVVRHMYPYLKNKPVEKDDGVRHDRQMLLPRNWTRKNIQTDFDRFFSYAGTQARDKELVITEFGAINLVKEEKTTKGKSARTGNTLSDALEHALLLQYWAEAGIPIAMKHMLVNPQPGPSDIVFPLGGGEYGVSAIGLAFGQLNRLRNTWLLPSWTADNPPGVKYEGDVRRALQVMAAKDERGAVLLLVTNINRAENIPASIQPLGLVASGEAQVWEMNGPSLAANNFPGHADEVKTTEKTVAIGGSGALQYVFPAHSITVIRLTGNQSPGGWTRLHSDDFDSASKDATPKGWELKGAAFLAPSLDGKGQSLSFINAGPQVAQARLFLGSEPADRLRFTFRVWAVQRNALLSVSLLDAKDAFVAGCGFGLKKAGCVDFAQDGKWVGTPQAFWQGVWHDIELTVDHSAGLYDLWLDGYRVVVGESQRLNPNAGPIQEMVFETPSTSASGPGFFADHVAVERWQ